jgi:serine/threonine-protein kinase
VKIDDYELVSKLGVGEWFEVWLARSGVTEVVLYNVAPHVDPGMIFLLLEDPLFARRFDHPNVVRVLDVGPSYVVTELVRGPPLWRMARVAALPEPLAVCAIVQAACGLHYIHQLKALHRDPVLHHLMVEPDGTVRWIGAMLRGLPRPESAGAMTGKFMYLSPEQARGGQPDARHEQFILGLGLYHLLTHRLAFGGDTDLERLEAAMRGVVDPEGLSPRLRPVVLRALAKLPEDRFPDVGAFGDALQPFASSKARFADYVARFL